MPPSSCTSKWRMRSVRLAASRTTANASGSSSSSARPSAWRFFSSSVLPRSCGSLSPASAGSSALICATAAEYCLSSRSLRLPKILVRTLVIMRWARGGRRAPAGLLKTADFTWKPGRLLGPGRRLRLRHQELHRVLRGAAIAHFEMQMRPGGAAGRAHLAQLAAALHHFALFHEQLLLVRVARDQIVAMVDVHHVAVLRVNAGENHDAVGCGHDGRAPVGQKIDAFVHGPLPGERID